MGAPGDKGSASSQPAQQRNQNTTELLRCERSVCSAISGFICSAVYQEFTQCWKGSMFMICDSFLHRFSLTASLYNFIIKMTGHQNTRELAAHHLPRMICRGASSGAKIICGGCFNLTMPQKGGVISSSKVHSVSVVSHRKRCQKDFQIFPVAFVQCCPILLKALLNCNNYLLLPFIPVSSLSLLLQAGTPSSL